MYTVYNYIYIYIYIQGRGGDINFHQLHTNPFKKKK